VSVTPPNGIDFLGHQPTGRYTNGRTIVDILGDRSTQSLCPSFTANFRCIAHLLSWKFSPSFFVLCIFSAGDGAGRVRAAVHGPGDRWRRRDERRQLRVRRRRHPEPNRQHLRQYTASTISVVRSRCAAILCNFYICICFCFHFESEVRRWSMAIASAWVPPSAASLLREHTTNKSLAACVAAHYPLN